MTDVQAASVSKLLAIPALSALVLSVGCGGGGDASADDSDTSSAAPSSMAASAWSEAFPTFERHVIDDFDGGYQAVFMDVNGDGLQDVAALSTGGSELVWYENPEWTRYDISTQLGGYINMAPHDIDGDGDLDLAVASDFSLGNSTGGGLVHWLEAPDDPTVDQEWAAIQIDQVPTSHRIRWADIDADGRSELVNLPIVGVGASAPEYNGAVELKAYEIPADLDGPWDATVLDDTRLEVAHGLAVVDWDGDAADDLLTASLAGVHLFRPSLDGPDAVQHVAAGHQAERPNAGSSEVALGELGGEGRFIGTNDPWHGNQVVVYRPNPDGSLPWAREVIDTTFTAGHALVTADFNGDGYDEIVAGHRGGDRNLFIYRFLPASSSWERIPLDLGGVAVSSLDVADFNGDGAPDVLTVGGATDNLVLYENVPVM